MTRKPRERRETSLGWEAQCAKCKDFWPEDSEFFFMSHGRPHSWCKACYRADPKIQAKTQRWREQQAGRAMPAPPPQFEFTYLVQAMRPQIQEALA
jgi:hypothetical protein